MASRTRTPFTWVPFLLREIDEAAVVAVNHHLRVAAGHTEVLDDDVTLRRTSEHHALGADGNDMLVSVLLERQFEHEIFEGMDSRKTIV